MKQHSWSLRTAAIVLWVAVMGVVVCTWLLYNPFSPSPARVDLQVYVGAARAVLSGEDLYEFRTARGLPFTYPPGAVLPFLPLAYLSFTASKVLAFFATWLSVFTIGVCVARYLRLCSPGGALAAIPREIAAPLIVLGLGLSHPVLSNNYFGQVSVPIVAMVVFDVLVVCRRWPRLGGVLIGAAAAIKLTPLAVIVALWWAGRRTAWPSGIAQHEAIEVKGGIRHEPFTAVNFRAAAYRGAATFVAFAMLGLVLFRSATIDYLLYRAGDMTRFGPYQSHRNQSINAFLFRIGLEGTLQRVVFLALAAVVLFLAWRRSAHLLRRGDPVSALIVMGAAMVAVSPVSWGHSQSWLWLAALLPVSVVWWRQGLWALFVIYMLSRAPITDFTGGAVPPVDVLVTSLRGLLAVAVACFIPVRLIPSTASSRASVGASSGHETSHVSVSRQSTA